MEKKIKERTLKTKIIEFSNIVEQNLEEILNELIANNYKRFDYNPDSLEKNYTNELYGEINRIIESMLVPVKEKPSIKGLFKRRNKDSDGFIPDIIRMVKFVNLLKDANNAVLLIKINITELYKYPTFKKQAYIPDFTLALSSFFKKNVDSFFTKTDIPEEEKDVSRKELNKIISLGHKIINEFFLNLTLENDGNLRDSGNQVIYYSNIITLLELISINCFEFTQI